MIAFLLASVVGRSKNENNTEGKTDVFLIGNSQTVKVVERLYPPVASLIPELAIFNWVRSFLKLT